MTSPIGTCVRVNWDYSVEFVPVDPAHEIAPGFETVEYWRQDDKWVLYHPRVKKPEGQDKFAAK